MRVGRLSEKSTHKIRVQTYNMDHTKEACVTALPSLVTESQKYAKSWIIEETSIIHGKIK